MSSVQSIPINYFIKRLLYTVPVVIGVTLITFIIFNMVGGDPSFHLAGKNASVEQVESIRNELGLNKSLPMQYLDFLKQSLTFDWGQSWSTQQNINQMFLDGLGPSLCLTLPAFILGISLSIFLALISTLAKSLNSGFDGGITTICLALMSVSFLVYIISFQYFFAFSLGLFEINGWSFDWTQRWSFLFLPWIISVFVSLGPNILIFRSAFLNEVNQDYVRTARAKGIPQIKIFSSHILKNSLVPVITIVMLQVPYLLTGSLLLEAFFGIPGLGGALIQAIQSADFPVIKAFTVIGSLAYVLINLFADFLYLVADPRIKLK